MCRRRKLQIVYFGLKLEVDEDSKVDLELKLLSEKDITRGRPCWSAEMK